MPTKFRSLSLSDLSDSLLDSEKDFAGLVIKSWPWLKQYDAVVVEEFAKTRTDMENVRIEMHKLIEGQSPWGPQDTKQFTDALANFQKNFHTCAANLYRPADDIAVAEPVDGLDQTGPDDPGQQQDLSDAERNVVRLFAGKKKHA